MIDTEAIRDQYPLHEIAAGDTKLKHQSGEWRGCCPLHGENTPSFTIHRRAGYERYHCFGCGADGDVLDYVVATRRASSLPEAARYLTKGEAIPSAGPKASTRTPPPDPYASVVPAMDEAPPLTPGFVQLWNPKNSTAHGFELTHVHPYPGLGYVVRHYVQGKKQTPFVTWTADNGWTRYRFPDEGRPLYLGQLLEAYPKAQVVVFEGEKKPDMFNALAIKGVIGIGFAGGAGAWARTDWSPLAGRSVVLWLDGDVPGMSAMFGKNGDPGLWDHLQPLAKSLRWIAPHPGQKTASWNVDDAVDAGWGADRVFAHMKQQLHRDPPGRQSNEPEPEPAKPVEQVKHTDNVVPLVRPRPQLLDLGAWQQDCNYTATTGTILAGSAWNWRQWIEKHPMIAGRFSMNSFDGDVWWTTRPEWDRPAGWVPRRLDGRDLTEIVTWMSKDRLSPRSQEVHEIMARDAMDRPFNSLTSVLDDLVWDGVPRLDTMMQTYASSPDVPEFRATPRKWMISAVARAYEPGCKVDTMLILEGSQGLGKSTLFSVLGTIVSKAHYSDDIKDVDNKDTQLATVGRWIVEMAELSSLSKSAVSSMKAWLSRAVDNVRKPYDRSVIDKPRTFVVCGTVNPGQGGYLRDHTGNRRYWIVKAGAVDKAALERDVLQLWAEAVHLYKSGEQWWLTAEEDELAARVQESRMERNPKEGRVAEWLREVTLSEISIMDVWTGALGGQPSQLRSVEAAEIGEIMVKCGWEQYRPRINGTRPQMWRRK